MIVIQLKENFFSNTDLFGEWII
jgi:ABC-type uncharacterized transport system permease subunit